MAAFSKINHAINEGKLKPGDHIYCYRSGHFSIYAHHGIYIGDNKVINFLDNSTGENGEGVRLLGAGSSSSSKLRCEECKTNKGGGVQMTCLKCFLKDDTLRIFLYGVSKTTLAINVRGGCSGMKADEVKQVLNRAKYLLRTDGFGRYNLHNHNCEDFSIYCKTGVVDFTNGLSKQVELFRQASKVSKSLGGKKKFNPVKVLTQMKTHLVDERWDRDSTGCHIAVEELVKMYETQKIARLAKSTEEKLALTFPEGSDPAKACKEVQL